MVSFTTILALSLGVAARVHGFPQRPNGPPANCLTPNDAQIVADGWAKIIGNFSTGLVNALIHENFTEYTESALSLNSGCLKAPVELAGPSQANPDLEAPIWTNRTVFEMLQGSDESYETKITNVWNTCEEVIMRWKLTSTGSRPVYGILVFETVPATSPQTYDGVTYKHLIKTSYYEFANYAWLQNILDAGTCKDPLTGKPKSSLP